MSKFKVIIIGDTYTGKTSLITQYAKNIFQKSYLPTVLPNLQTVNSRFNCELDIWDTAGTEQWQSLNSTIYHHTDALIFLCSYDRQDSLDNIQNLWIPRINGYISLDKIPIYLAINKSDLRDEEKYIEEAQFERIASEINAIQFFNVSAKENKNVRELFDTVAEKLSNQVQNHAVTGSAVHVTNDEASQEKKCC